jgi:hypothetical protein
MQQASDQPVLSPTVNMETVPGSVATVTIAADSPACGKGPRGADYPDAGRKQLHLPRPIPIVPNVKTRFASGTR